MTRQAMQLGWLPGFEIRQTSDQVYGQIYVPVVNGLMAVGTVLIALSFRSSDRLAGAFGTAVATTMVLTTFLLIRAMTHIWRWPILIVAPLALLFLTVDVGFFVANLAKIVDGGWIPLTLGTAIFVVMVTWRTGVQALRDKLASLAEPVDAFLAELKAERVPRVPGAAVFLTRPTDKIPAFVSDYVRNMGSLHKTVLALHVRFEERPRVEEAERAEVEEVAPEFWRVTLRYGFIEAPDIVGALRSVKGLPSTAPDQAVFFATRGHRHASEPLRPVPLAARPVFLPLPQRRPRHRPLQPASGPHCRGRPTGPAMTDQAPSRSLVIAADGAGAVDRIDFQTRMDCVRTDRAAEHKLSRKTIALRVRPASALNIRTGERRKLALSGNRVIAPAA